MKSGIHEALSLESVSKRLKQFVEERDWDQFHSPRNLAVALCVEAAELLEQFQWLTEEESRKLPAQTKEAVSNEMADVLLYLLRLSEKLEVNLLQAALAKIEINRRKYPVEKSKGRHTKYDNL